MVLKAIFFNTSLAPSNACGMIIRILPIRRCPNPLSLYLACKPCYPTSACPACPVEPPAFVRPPALLDRVPFGCLTGGTLWVSNWGSPLDAQPGSNIYPVQPVVALVLPEHAVWPPAFPSCKLYPPACKPTGWLPARRAYSSERSEAGSQPLNRLRKLLVF